MTDHNKSTLPMRIAIYEALKEAGAKDGEFYRYANGGSDAKVAARLGVRQGHVENVRRTMFGLLFARPQPATDSHIRRIDDLERRLQAIEEWATSKGRSL